MLFEFDCQLPQCLSAARLDFRRHVAEEVFLFLREVLLFGQHFLTLLQCLQNLNHSVCNFLFAVLLQAGLHGVDFLLVMLEQRLYLAVGTLVIALSKIGQQVSELVTSLLPNFWVQRRRFFACVFGVRNRVGACIELGLRFRVGLLDLLANQLSRRVLFSASRLA